MLGPPKARCLDFPVLVSLEALVPPGHFYRHLEAALDLGFVRAWVADCYAERRTRLGRPTFRRFFEHVVQLCLDAGLVWGEELFFEAPKVRANAVMASVVPRLAEVVDGHLVGLFGSERDEAEAADGPSAATIEPAAPAPECVIPFPRPAAVPSWRHPA